MPPWQNHRQGSMNNMEDLDKLLWEVVRKNLERNAGDNNEHRKRYIHRKERWN